MLVYLFCATYTSMTMNESSPPCDQRCITKSNVKSKFKKMCLETRFKLGSAMLYAMLYATLRYAAL